jgi:hypothetical protein
MEIEPTHKKDSKHQETTKNTREQELPRKEWHTLNTD